MRFVVLISLFLAWVLIATSNPPQQIAAGYSNATESVAARALEPAALISCIIVFLFFYLRFSEWPQNTPLHLVKRPPRFYTTRLRYHLAASIYGMLMVGMFLIIYLFPDAFLNVLQSTSKGITAFASTTQDADKSLAKILSDLAQLVSSQQSEWVYLAIVFVIVIWPKLPFSTDEAMRAILQRFAAIPTEARILIGHLRQDDSFVADSMVVKRIVEKSKLLEPRDFNHGDDRKRIGFLYAKLCYLTNRVEAETANREFLSSELQQPERYKDLERRVAEMADRLRDFRDDLIAELREIDAEAVDRFFNDHNFTTSNCSLQSVLELSQEMTPTGNVAARYLRQQETALALELEQMLDDVYYFIVTCILSCEPSPRARIRRFAKLGIVLPQGHLPFEEGDALTFLFVSLFVVIIVPTLAFFAWDRIVDFESLKTSCGELVPSHVGEAFGWSFIGMLQHGLAVIAAFVLTFTIEAHRSMYDEVTLMEARQDTFRRTASSVSTFINGAGIAFSANVVLFALIGQIAMPVDATDCRLDSTWIWTLIPALTGGLTALYLCLEPDRKHTIMLAGLQALLTGLLTGLIGIYIVGLPSDTGSVEFAFLFYVIITSMLLGLAAGLIVLEITKKLSPKKAAFQQMMIEDVVSATILIENRIIPVELQQLSQSGVVVNGKLGLEPGTSCLLLLPSVGELPVIVEFVGDESTHLAIQMADITANKVRKKSINEQLLSNTNAVSSEPVDKPSDA